MSNGNYSDSRRVELHQQLLKHFNAEELNTICFNLGLEYEDLPGKGRAAKARELVKYLEGLDRIPELMNLGKKLRPNGRWDYVLLKDVVKSPVFEILNDEANPQFDEVNSRVSMGYLWGITSILVIVLIGSVFLLAQFNSGMKCIRQIFADSPRYVRVGSYGANGKANSRTSCNNVLDGRKDYLEITLQSFREERDGESGVILVVNELNIGQSELISFEVKGEHGGEQFGIKLKNVDGVEETVWLTDDLNNIGLTTDWEEVMIPLNKFLGISVRPIESITFFSDGRAGLEPQKFYVSQIGFE